LGIRNTRNKKRALEAAKARNEIATNDFDTPADEEAKKERLSVKFNLAKSASAKKYKKRKGKKEKASVGSRVLNIVFPPRQVDLANRMINGKEVIKRKDPFWQDIWDYDWIVLPDTTKGHCLVCKREGVLDADCVFGKNHFADHYRRKHLKLETKPRDIPKYTKSDYVGVQGQGRKWKARIGSLSLGSFDTEVEAARAYDTAVLARDAGKPSNLRAKTNFANEDQNILPELEKQLILQKVEAKRAQIALQKVHARKYIGVSTRTYGRVLKYRASFMNIEIELLFDTAEQAAAARDYVGMSNDSNYKRQLDKNTFGKLLTDDQKRQVNKNFLEKLAERNQKQASKKRKSEK